MWATPSVRSRSRAVLLLVCRLIGRQPAFGQDLVRLLPAPDEWGTCHRRSVRWWHWDRRGCGQFSCRDSRDDGCLLPGVLEDRVVPVSALLDPAKGQFMK